VVKYW